MWDSFYFFCILTLIASSRPKMSGQFFGTAYLLLLFWTFEVFSEGKLIILFREVGVKNFPLVDTLSEIKVNLCLFPWDIISNKKFKTSLEAAYPVEMVNKTFLSMLSWNVFMRLLIAVIMLWRFLILLYSVILQRIRCIIFLRQTNIFPDSS